METGLLSLALASLLLSGICSIYYLRWLLSDSSEVPITPSLHAGVMGAASIVVCLVSLDLSNARLPSTYGLTNGVPLNSTLTIGSIWLGARTRRSLRKWL
jgi:hypothetical protein